MGVSAGDVLILPFYGQGHLYPCIELCKRISSYNLNSVLVIPSHLSSSIPSSLRHHPSIRVEEIKVSARPPSPPSWKAPVHGFRPFHNHHAHPELGQGIESFLQDGYVGLGKTQPVCVVIDAMMSWTKEIFQRNGVPIVSFFTSGACSAAVEYSAWKEQVGDLKQGETRVLPGLPETMALTYGDILRRPHHWRKPLGVGGGSGRPNFGPSRPGGLPRWLEEVDGSTVLLINTYNELEGPFIDYIGRQIGRPVFGVGPLLPEKYWEGSGLILRDQDSRPNRESNYTEDEVIEWLDSKPSQSVIYVSFGSEVGPTMEEYSQLADALGEINWPFIWVIQSGSGIPKPPLNFFGNSKPKEEGYHPHGLQEKVGNRGLIIKGWAPQLLILSHPSTGGFLSHCGWNSTIEAIGRGVPILAWPIRGDQYYNAKMVVNYLKIGHMVASGEELAEMVKKDVIVRGIDKLMDDEEVHEKARSLKNIFEAGFPSSSVDSLKGFIEIISK